MKPLKLFSLLSSKRCTIVSGLFYPAVFMAQCPLGGSMCDISHRYVKEINIKNMLKCLKNYGYTLF